MAQRPAHEIRIGRIRATIWVHQPDGRNAAFNTTITRLYKDGEVWRDSTVFYRDDLPVIAKVADMAYSWIWTHGTQVESSAILDTHTATRN